MMNIEELQLSVRSFNALKRAHIDTVEQLKQMSAYEISRIRNIGKTCVDEILVKLSYIAITNADHIRAISDEELAEFLDSNKSHGCVCPARDCRVTCRQCITEWLAEPYKEKE
jgi:hypothetical protein